jgi:hypothetical protein
MLHGLQGVDARHELALGPAEGRTRVAGHDESEFAAVGISLIMMRLG